MRSPIGLPKLSQLSLRTVWEQPALQRFITRNLALKLLALFLAVTIWGFIAPQRRGESTEFKFQSPLVLRNIPPNMEITSELLQSVSVLVRTPRNLSKTLNPNLFQVGIDLRNQLPGTFDYSLTEKNVTYDNEASPGGLEVLQISPARFSLVLEEVLERTVPIKLRLMGRVSEGLIIESAEVVPAEVTVAGPASVVENLDSITTEPLDIQDLDTNVDMLASLEIPHHQVRILDSEDTLYMAQIKVGFTPMQVLLLDVPVILENAEFAYQTSTQTVNALIVGPQSAVANLNNGNVFAVIDLSEYPPGDYRALTPKVVLPDLVTVVEQWPIVDLFVLKRKIGES